MASTLATRQDWWVQTAEKATKSPAFGCNTTSLASEKIFPPPTGTSLALPITVPEADSDAAGADSDAAGAEDSEASGAFDSVAVAGELPVAFEVAGAADSEDEQAANAAAEAPASRARAERRDVPAVVGMS